MHPFPLLRRDTDKESETVRPHGEGIDVGPSQSILLISSHCDPRTRLDFALPQRLCLMLVTKMKRAEKFNKTHNQQNTFVASDKANLEASVKAFKLKGW